MSDSAVAVDLDHSLDVHTDFAAEITLNMVVVFDLLTELSHFILGQILRAGIGAYPGCSKNLVRAGSADSVYICECYFDALCVRNINTCYTSRKSISFLNPVSACA